MLLYELAMLPYTCFKMLSAECCLWPSSLGIAAHMLPLDAMPFSSLFSPCHIIYAIFFQLSSPPPLLSFQSRHAAIRSILAFDVVAIC